MIGSFKCRRCKHCHNPNERPSEWKCDAYNGLIPEEKIMHISRDECVNCNNGIGFEQKEEPAQK